MTNSECQQLDCTTAEEASQKKMGNAKRYAQVATATVVCLLSSGIVFGFAALKPVLVAEGVYSELCHPNGHRHARSDQPCPEQDLRLNVFFNSASVTTNVSSLIAGIVLDRFGRRTCWLLSSVFLMAGCILMGASFAYETFNGFMSANVFLALGGIFVFVPSFQLANAFPEYSGTIIAVITCAFDASAAIFLFYRMLYNATGGRFSAEKFFFGYTIVPVIILIAELTYMPRKAYASPLPLDDDMNMSQAQLSIPHEEDKVSSDTETSSKSITSSESKTLVNSPNQAQDSDQLVEPPSKTEKSEQATAPPNKPQEARRVRNKLKRSAKSREKQARKDRRRAERAGGIVEHMHDKAVHRQMMTLWFIFILLLTMVQMVRMNYLIANIHEQYQYILGSEKRATAINNFFDIALPIGGIASTPFIGLLLSKLSITWIFSLVTILIVFNSVLNCLTYSWAGYATVIAFVIYRPLYYSAISDYATKVFGFATFGRIYGTVVCFSGLVNLIQPRLDAMTQGTLGGNPTPVNIALGAAGTVISASLTLFVAVKVRKPVGDEEQAKKEKSSFMTKLSCFGRKREE